MAVVMAVTGLLRPASRSRRLVVESLSLPQAADDSAIAAVASVHVARMTAVFVSSVGRLCVCMVLVPREVS